MRAALARMAAAMQHRGPDDEGIETIAIGGQQEGPTVGFGFRRLAILDLSPAGHQPMFDPASGNCLIFNGEIYNYRHLRARLMVEGVRFRSTGDTQGNRILIALFSSENAFQDVVTPSGLEPLASNGALFH